MKYDTKDLPDELYQRALDEVNSIMSRLTQFDMNTAFLIVQNLLAYCLYKTVKPEHWKVVLEDTSKSLLEAMDTMEKGGTDG